MHKPRALNYIKVMKLLNSELQKIVTVKVSGSIKLLVPNKKLVYRDVHMMLLVLIIVAQLNVYFYNVLAKMKLRRLKLYLHQLKFS